MFARSPWFLVNRLSGGPGSGSAPARAPDADDVISLGGFEMVDDEGLTPLVASGPSSSSRGDGSGIASSSLRLGGGLGCAGGKIQDTSTHIHMCVYILNEYCSNFNFRAYMIGNCL